MNGELHYWQHRWRRRAIWAASYILLFGLVVILLYWVGDQFRTHTLPVGTIQLSVSQVHYVVGEPVVFTITNKLNTSVYATNECPTEPLDVYKLVNQKWVRQIDSTDVQSCQDEQRQVATPADSSVTGSFASWPQLFNSPGTYRIVAVINNYNGLPYVDFNVVASTSAASQRNQQQITSPRSEQDN
ncbi:MAG: hypothetical protein ABI602_02595 [Candidatus Saccharibacteria bacterium]